MGKQRGRVSSPEATGGAGPVFEQHVDATFLALLLVRAIPPVLTDCQLKEVHFQTEHLGWRTDDLLVVGVNGAGGRRRLAGQVKRTFTVSSKDLDCRKTFSGFWHDFSEVSRFDRSHDRLAVITLRGTETLLRLFNSLLDCARASLDAGDFAHRLTAPGYMDQKARRYAEEIRLIVDEAAGSAVPDDDFWQFLKVVHVLSLDLNTPTAQTEASVKTLLAYTSTEHDKLGVAEATWNELLALAGTAMRGGSYTRDKLPASLQGRHSATGPAEHWALQVLRDHGATVMTGIRSTIGGSLVLPRDELFTQCIERLEENRVVVITGPAGYGKSALGKRVFESLQKDHFAFAFRAEEFATPHLDETLQRAQVRLGARPLYALLSGQARKLLVIESVERLLEASVRDAFSDLLGLVKQDESWRLILTCRDYSLDIVRSSLLEHADLPHAVVTVPSLTDEDLSHAISEFPQLKRASANPSLRKLFRNLYLLDKASRMAWPEDRPLPEDEHSFRSKFWSEVVRDDAHNASGLPQRRERTFIEIALRRARALALFAPCDNLDAEAVGQLRQQDLIVFSEKTAALAAPAHDVLEDWAILQWIEERFTSHEGNARLIAEDINGFPAIRRAYRKWLGESLECEPGEADPFVLSVVEDELLPSQFRDDTFVSVLLSPSVGVFVERHRARLVENDLSLLRRVIHLTRVACVTAPSWLPSHKALTSAFLVPSGSVWPAVLRLTMEELDKFLPGGAALLLGLIEDWAKAVAWWAPHPKGTEYAAKIAFALLPHLDKYDNRDLRKRTLQVIAKVPRGDSAAFLKLVKQAGEDDRDGESEADFAKLLLEGIEGGFACREFPQALIDLAEKWWFLTNADLESEAYIEHSLDIGPIFGLRDHLDIGFFPASAIRGPFMPLLQGHPLMGVEFIVRLMNRTVTWYAEGKWLDGRLEPAIEVHLRTPDGGELTQWANGRLWCLYRGTSVGPYVMQTALMALENWLLDCCKREDYNLELWLLKLLCESNNVAVTAVVASLSNAYPMRAGKAALALLTCRELFSLDRDRMVHESQAASLLANLMPAARAEHEFYYRERKQTDALPHRKNDLEALAVRFQLGGQQDVVQQIIDGHRQSLPAVSEQTEEDKLWRLALHRMDLRNHTAEIIEVPPGSEQQEGKSVAGKDQPGKQKGKAIMLCPGPLDEDIQAMLDREAPALVREQADMALLMWGISVWDREKPDLFDPTEWLARLSQAKTRWTDGAETAEFVRGGPALVASVCIRDHWDEMGQEDQDWCVGILISAIERDCDSDDMMVRVTRLSFDASRRAAYVLPLVLSRSSNGKDARLVRAIAQAITHASTEVVAYAAEGIGTYLGDSYRDFAIRCVAALAEKARLLHELVASQEKQPYKERQDPEQLVRQVTPQVRAIMVGGGDVSPDDVLLRLDLDGWPAKEVMGPILTILRHCPGESLAVKAHKMVADKVVNWWDRDRDSRGKTHGERDIDRDFEWLERVARFTLRLPPSDALNVVEALMGAVDRHPREVARFVENLIVAEDQADGPTSFWSVWQAIADGIKGAPWVSELDSRYAHGKELMGAIFLGISWKEGVRHWRRLNGCADRIDRLFESLPPSAASLESYCRFLYTVGSKSLPKAFLVIAKQLAVGDARKMLSISNTVFCLESLLRQSVYSTPLQLKADAQMGSAVLKILDELVESGSSAAYRMRDDFVTPVST
jgi:hypothetical protein